MAYTPELTKKEAQTLRRIAWALGCTMTKATRRIYEHLPKHLDAAKICVACKDKTLCEGCAFNNKKSFQQEKEA